MDTPQALNRTAGIGQRMRALESVLHDHGLDTATGLPALDHAATEEWGAQRCVGIFESDSETA